MNNEKALSDYIAEAVESYLAALQDETPSNIYETFLREFERPLLDTIMIHARGNQSEATRMLGISRSNLRKKLALYNLD